MLAEVDKDSILSSISPVEDIIKEEEVVVVDINKEVECKEVGICRVICQCLALTSNINNRCLSLNNSPLACPSLNRCNRT
jgi:hypothetical protein